MSNIIRTIGDSVKERFERAKNFYKTFKKDENFAIRDIAVDLARHDLLMENLISQLALEDLDKWLEEQKGADR